MINSQSFFICRNLARCICEQEDQANWQEKEEEGCRQRGIVARWRLAKTIFRSSHSASALSIFFSVFFFFFFASFFFVPSVWRLFYLAARSSALLRLRGIFNKSHWLRSPISLSLSFSARRTSWHFNLLTSK